MGNMLVNTEWVAQQGRASHVRLLEVDVDTSAYDHGHVQGAFGVNWTSQLCDSVRRDVLTPTQFKQLCSQLGITANTTVVFYGDNNNWFAAYALWQFRYHGHAKDKLKLMDGGRTKWILEGRRLVTEVPTTEPSIYVPAEPTHAIRCFKDEVFAHLDHGTLNLVDVRSPAEYRGEVIAPPGMKESALRGGHIPGAINIPWTETVNEDGTFKSWDELLDLFTRAGLDPNRKTVVYCRIGERSAHTWFALAGLLGLDDVCNYDGSWTEWGNLISAPIERAD